MVTVDRLVNVLGGYGVRPLTGVPDRERALHSVAMLDPAATEVATGDTLLAVGIRSVATAVRLAVAAQAGVVLVHGSREDGSTGTAVTDHTSADHVGAEERAAPGGGSGDTAAGSADTEHDGGIAAPIGGADFVDRTGRARSRTKAVAEAERHGITVLLVDADVSWSQVCGVVYGLVFEGGETGSGRGSSDLFALADTVAGTVGGQVTIEDRLSRVVAYSSWQQDADPARLDTILGRRVAEPVRQLFELRGVFRHLGTSDEPLFVAPAPEHGLRGRMVAAARAGRELLGSVWVTCDEPLTGARYRALRDGAQAVASHLLRSRVSADLERQVESELVIRLLEGTPDATSVCGTLGLPPETFRVVAVQAHADDERHAAVLLAYERATVGFGWSRPGRSTLFGNTVYTILPCGDDPLPAREWLRELMRELPGHVSVSAGIGGVCEVSQLPAGRREADECLALHTIEPGSPPVEYDESWDEILLHRLRTAARSGRTPTRGPIVDLARHDDAHNTHYLATLRVWLDVQGDLGVASRELGVHPNTVRYRMRRMSEIAKLQLDDPDKRRALLIALAVR